MLEFQKKSDRQKGCGVLSKQVLDVRTDRGGGKIYFGNFFF